MCVSVAAYHLWLDWRAFGPGLAQLFTDYEPGIHWNQCQILSGVTGIDALSAYDPVQQSQELDPDGTFLRQWLPELAQVPAPLIHEPWKLTALEQKDVGCEIGKDYPAPLVDPLHSAKRAEEKICAVRKIQGFAEETQRVLKMHGTPRPSEDEHHLDL